MNNLSIEDMRTLSALVDAFQSLPFPQFPEDDELNDWVADLVQADAYYAGHAASIAGGVKGRVINQDHLQELINRLEKISMPAGEDKKIYLYCRRYLASLTSLVHETNKLNP